MPNVAVASTGNYSTSFYNSARRIGDHIPMARGRTSNGISNWNYVTEGSSAFSATPNGTVYIGSKDDNVYALYAYTGTKIWSYKTAGEFLMDSSPAVANGIVYIGSADHNVYALNANTGTKIWSYKTGSFVSSSPTVTNGIVYVGSDDNDIYALNANTGTKIWNYTTGG